MIDKSELMNALGVPARRMDIIGRAVTALNDLQTASERSGGYSNRQNGQGFNRDDAKNGSITAATYKKWGRLPAWVVDKWMEVDGAYRTPRIAKYWRQLPPSVLGTYHVAQWQLPLPAPRVISEEENEALAAIALDAIRASLRAA